MLTDGAGPDRGRPCRAEHGGSRRGCTNIWFVFLPPSVDECIQPGACGTNAFGGYHSVSDVGHGVTIYAVAIDPIIEVDGPARAPTRGQSRRRGGDRRRRARDRRGDDRSRGRRLDGPERVRGRRQVRVRAQNGTPLGFAGQRLALQPGDQRPQVPAPGDVVERRRQRQPGLRAGHHDHGQPAAAAAGQPDASSAHTSPATSTGRDRRGVGVTGNAASRRRRRATRSRSPRHRPRPPPTAAGRCRSARTPSATTATRSTSTYSGAGAPTPSHQVILTGNGGDPFTESGWIGVDVSTMARVATSSATNGRR